MQEFKKISNNLAAQLSVAKRSIAPTNKIETLKHPSIYNAKDNCTLRPSQTEVICTGLCT